VLVVLRLSRLAPVRWRVLVAWSGERVSRAERGHGRSEQPDQDKPARSRQPLLTGSTRVDAAAESANPGSFYMCLRGANGLGPLTSATSGLAQKRLREFYDFRGTDAWSALTW
jgi:hypothetical protein